MFIKKKKGWEIPSSESTPEAVYVNRRSFMRSAGTYGLGAGLAMTGVGGFLGLFGSDKKEPEKLVIPETSTSYLYPAKRNARFTLDRTLTDEMVAATYNNFYEFSSDKEVWKYVDGFSPRPWTVELTGLVEKSLVYDIDTLIKKMPLEERLYRHRCVEAWAMAVPWTGFPLKELVRLARPTSGAKFLEMTTFYDTSLSSAQKYKIWLPWPYREALSMDEATNDLAFIATGIYGHELPAQHGSPLRLVVPWKYGFKSIKSIVRFEFTDARPKTFWPAVVPDEYHFVSNVNPDVPHPRWSQKTERMIGTGEVRDTVKYNGYGQYVAGIYGG